MTLTLSFLLLCALFLGIFLLTIVILWALSTARRLDRLHQRCNQSWAALVGALGTRATVARLVAAKLRDADQQELAKRIFLAASMCEGAVPESKEQLENDLSVVLSAVNPHFLDQILLMELIDASTRVVVARQFFNDAVRDTRAQHARLSVRVLRLAGHATSPSFFEIAPVHLEE